jgi:hypothetical protein
MPHREHWATSSGRGRPDGVGAGGPGSVKLELTGSCSGPVSGGVAGLSTAILDMSGFLLKLVRHKVPAACCEHLAGTARG